MKDHLKKVKDIYWSEQKNAPVFILEDGREFYPEYYGDGTILWKVYLIQSNAK